MTLTIWHVGGESSPQAVNGVNSAVWALANRQAEEGHRVTVICRRTFERHLGGVVVSTYRHAIWMRRFPDVIHMHSVFVPQQALLALLAKLRGVPYVITPHGGLMPQILERHGLAKRVYRRIVERSRLRGAHGILAVAFREKMDIQSFAGADIAVHVIPNPVETPRAESPVEALDPEAQEVVFLGRIERHWKGLDRVIELARLLPEISFSFYGEGGWSGDLPQNVKIRPPIFGEQKTRTLQRSRALIHLPRWEVFGISVIEAMRAGIPVIASRDMYLADELESSGALVLDLVDLQEDASVVREALRAGRGRPPYDPQFLAKFDISTVTSSTVAVYRDAVE